MNCPLCPESVLDVTFHAGIELDICPTCRGVWLDRGELDRIAAGTAPTRTNTNEDDHDADDAEGNPRDGRKSKKRKKTLASRLGDVFEEIIDL